MPPIQKKSSPAVLPLFLKTALLDMSGNWMYVCICICFCGCFCAGFFIALSPKDAAAHFLLTDGSIGAVLHMDPDDDPIAGQPAVFHYEIKDKQGKFTPQGCTCTFSISENGASIFSQDLYLNTPQNSLDVPLVTYTFPKLDVYQIILTGTPKPGADFQPFTLTYNARISRQAATGSAGAAAGTQPENHTAHIILISAGVIIIIGIIFYDQRKQRTQKIPANQKIPPEQNLSDDPDKHS